MDEFYLEGGQVRQRQARPHVQFFIHPVLDREETERTGVKSYTDTLYLKKRAQGSKDCISRKATENDKRQWASEYQAFLSSQGAAQEAGTAIDLLVKAPADLAGLKAMGISTVERLASVDVLPESLRPYQAKARAFMELMTNEDESTEARRQVN